MDHLHEAKVLLVGKGGAGRTSLLTRLYYPGRPLPDEKDTTQGIDVHPKQFLLSDDRVFRLNVWDSLIGAADPKNHYRRLLANWVSLGIFFNS